MNGDGRVSLLEFQTAMIKVFPSWSSESLVPLFNEIDAGFFCGNVGLFSGFIGLFSGFVGLFGHTHKHTQTHKHTHTHTHTHTHERHIGLF